jgi:hypothetical protein
VACSLRGVAAAPPCLAPLSLWSVPQVGVLRHISVSDDRSSLTQGLADARRPPAHRHVHDVRVRPYVHYSPYAHAPCDSRRPQSSLSTRLLSRTGPRVSLSNRR